MNRFLLLGATVLLVSCDSDRSLSANNLSTSDDLAADANTSVGSPSAASMTLLNTTWEFSDSGTELADTFRTLEEQTDDTNVTEPSYPDEAESLPAAGGGMPTERGT